MGSLLEKEIHFDKVNTKVVKAACLIVFCVFVIGEAWIADDAYHVFTMSKNFINCNGLVYNIGERTNAATCPLMLLLITFSSFITRRIEITAIFIGVFASVTAFLIFIRRLYSRTSVIVVTIICLFSYSFMAYTTSGLETSLIYLIQIVYFEFILYHDRKFSFRELLYVSFLCSLSLLARFDTCFLLFFPTVYVFLTKRNCSIVQMVSAAIIGLLPFFGWLVFSIIYYGYPFPNTYYIKLRTDISSGEYMVKGLNFYKMMFQCDTITILIILIAVIILLLKTKAWLYKWIVIGIIAKMIYVLRIGGDFMLGRHLAGLFFVSLYIILYLYNSKQITSVYIRTIATKRILILVGVVLIAFSTLGYIGRSTFLYPYNDVADERKFYIYRTNIFSIIESDITGNNYPLYTWLSYIPSVEKCIEEGYYGDVLPWAPGILVFNYADRLHMTDQCSIADPLLPYMGMDYEKSKNYIPYGTNETWRIGHMQRQIPEGYRESLQQNKNLVKDPVIHKLYDKILLVVRGDLFTKERLKAIWELNTKYMNN